MLKLLAIVLLMMPTTLLAQKKGDMTVLHGSNTKAEPNWNTIVHVRVLDQENAELPFVAIGLVKDGDTLIAVSDFDGNLKFGVHVENETEVTLFLKQVSYIQDDVHEAFTIGPNDTVIREVHLTADDTPDPHIIQYIAPLKPKKDPNEFREERFKR